MTLPSPDCLCMISCQCFRGFAGCPSQPNNTPLLINIPLCQLALLRLWVPKVSGTLYLSSKSQLTLVAKTVLRNTTNQNVLSLISCKHVLTFARDLPFAFCLSVRDLSTDCEGNIHHQESAEALQIKALRVSRGTGFRTGWWKEWAHDVVQGDLVQNL